jgi:hypothetical protein
MEDQGLAMAFRRSCFAEGAKYDRRRRPKRGKKLKELELLEDIRNHKGWFKNAPTKQQRQRELPACFGEERRAPLPVHLPHGTLKRRAMEKEAAARGVGGNGGGGKSGAASVKDNKNDRGDDDDGLPSAGGRGVAAGDENGPAGGDSVHQSSPPQQQQQQQQGEKSRFAETGLHAFDIVKHGTELAAAHHREDRAALVLDRARGLVPGGVAPIPEPIPNDLLDRDASGGIVFRPRGGTGLGDDTGVRNGTGVGVGIGTGNSEWEHRWFGRPAAAGGNGGGDAMTVSERRLEEAAESLRVCARVTEDPLYRPTLLNAGPPCANLAAAQLRRLREGLREFQPLPQSEGRYKLPTTKSAGTLVDRLVTASSVEALRQRSIDQVLELAQELEAAVKSAVTAGDLEAESALRVALGFARARGTFARAEAEMGRAVLAAVAAADHGLECAALAALGTISWTENLHARAFAYDERLAVVALRVGDKLWECIAAFNLGCGYFALNYHAKAINLLQRAADLCEVVGAVGKAEMAALNGRMVARIQRILRKRKEEEAARIAKAKAKREREAALMRRWGFI